MISNEFCDTLYHSKAPHPGDERTAAGAISVLDVATPLDVLILRERVRG